MKYDDDKLCQQFDSNGESDIVIHESLETMSTPVDSCDMMATPCDHDMEITNGSCHKNVSDSVPLTPRHRKMRFDDILEKIGEFGWYQKKIYFLLCLSSLVCGLHVFLPVFHLATPPFRCALLDYPNDTYSIQSTHHESLINESIPWIYTDFSYRYDSCHRRNSSMNVSSHECNQWVYDIQSGMSSSTTTQMNIVCKNRVMRSHMKMTYMAGKLIGSFVFGAAADIFGRKKVLLVALLFHFVSGVLNAFVTDHIQYAACRFFNGAASSGVFVGSFVLGMEMVGKSKRMWAGMVIELFFALGSVIVAGTAFLIRDWIILQIVLASPSILFVSYIWLLPESPRWLITQSKIKDARIILKKIADSNGTVLPDNMALKDEEGELLPKARLWYLCMTKTLAFRTFVVITNWMVVTGVYYGLSLNSGELHENLFLGYFLSAIMEFPAIFICMLLIDRIGRKWLHTSMMLVGGGANLCTIFSVLYGNRGVQWVTLALALIGKMGATGAFAVIYMFTSELYPTVLRNGAMGTSSMAARVGGIIAPYIADLGHLIDTNFGKALPLVIFGATTVVAGLLALTLPETLNQPLPDTMQEANNFGKSPTSDWKTQDQKTPIIQQPSMETNFC